MANGLFPWLMKDGGGGSMVAKKLPCLNMDLLKKVPLTLRVRGASLFLSLESVTV